MVDRCSGSYVSRGGIKLAAALDALQVNVAGKRCADLGSHVGGFVDCLLQRGAERVYSIDTGYGVLAWKLRKDHRVVVMERTNAMHATLPESVELVTIDVGWTKQVKVLPAVRGLLSERGCVVALIKPQYEAGDDELLHGVVRTDAVDAVLSRTLDQICALGWIIAATTESPIPGHGGNTEQFVLLATS